MTTTPLLTGVKVRQFRTDLGLTQIELGNMLGYSGHPGISISRIERGERVLGHTGANLLLAMRFGGWVPIMEPKDVPQ